MIYRLLTLFFVLVMRAGFAQDSAVVYFDFDKSELGAQSKQSLDVLLARPNLFSAVIYGHSDQLGSHAYNDRLSLKRADAVKEYLRTKGVDAAKIRVVKGFGETMPAINKLDEASRRANRRVVVIASYEVTARDSIVMEAPEASPRPVNPGQKPKGKLIDEIKDSSTKEGASIVLRNINFYGGRHVFLPQSYSALTELLYVMQTVPALEIEIQGHICCKDGESDGVDLDTGEPYLSFNRAKAVYEYLVEKGIDKKRMTYKGYGHKYPLMPFERNDEERTANRRVEIKILKK